MTVRFAHPVRMEAGGLRRLGGKPINNLPRIYSTTRQQLVFNRSHKVCVDVYGPRVIATVCLVLVSRLRLLTYIRLL